MAFDSDDALTDNLDVPLAWLAAEHAAQRLISDHHPDWSPALFQYRTVECVLALTIFLNETDEPARQPAPGLANRWTTLRERTRSAPGWASWCVRRLARMSDDTVASYRLACSAWQWLCRSRLLYDSAYAADCGAGLSPGVDLAHRMLAITESGSDTAA